MGAPAASLHAKPAGRSTARVVVEVGSAFIVLLLVVAAATIYVQRAQAIEEWRSNLIGLSRLLAEHAGQSIKAADLVEKSIADRVAELGVDSDRALRTQLGTRATFDMLRDKASGVPQIDVATVVAANGDVVNFTRSYPPPPINLADRDYFRAHVTDPDLKFFLSVPVKNRGTGRWTFYLTRKIKAPAGQTIGLTLAGIESSFFADFYKAVNFSEFSAISLYRTDGAMLARFPDRDESMGKIFPDQPALKAFRSGEESVITSEPRLVDPSDTRFRIAAVHGVPDYPLVVIVVATEEMVLAAWRQRATVIGGGSVLLSMLAAGLMVWIRRLIGKREDALVSLRRSEAELANKADMLEERTRLVEHHYDSLRALNDIAAAAHADLRDQLVEALALGSRHLGLPVGIISRIDGDTYTVIHHAAPDGSELADGQRFSLQQTYCALVMDTGDLVAIPHMAVSAHAGHPCYQAFHLEAYIGIPVMVGGTVFGTVNFSSPEPYDHEFDEGDAEFMRLLARWIGAAMDRDLASREVVAAKEVAEAAQRDLALQGRKLAESNAELEQFAYVASHDLRQPLRMISSYLRLIETRLGEDLSEDMKTFIGFAVSGAKRMDGLILGLLEYSRIGRGRPDFEAVPLAEVVGESLLNLNMEIEESGAEVVVQDGLPTVRGSRLDLMRLFQNLIGNAVKYRSPERPPKVEVGWRQGGREWVVSVADNGIGINDDDRERAFQVFQRLVPADAYEGTGIGLAVCRKIVDLHGGRIWIEAAPAGGSIFNFTLPAGAPKP
ncbi:MAG: ATP-binding protein [Actinomycetota bacterium]